MTECTSCVSDANRSRASRPTSAPCERLSPSRAAARPPPRPRRTPRGRGRRPRGARRRRPGAARGPGAPRWDADVPDHLWANANETVAAELVAEKLRAAGVEPKIFEKKKGRGNCVARIKGTGQKPPLLLNAHLDVVGRKVRDAVRAAGGVPFEFNTIGVDDGIAMGHGGMKYSLASRELIADCVETMLRAPVRYPALTPHSR